MDPQTIHRRRWAILGVLVLCLLVVILDNTILNVALKTIQDDLDATQSELEWAINSYTLVFAGLMFTAGVLGDRYGRRLFLVVGLVLFGAASVLSAFSQTPEQLIATRALMGIGAAMTQPQTLSIIQNVFPPNERGKAIGIWAGFSGIAIALGPVTGGLLLEHFWWGSVFLINVPFVLVGFVALMLLVPESKDPNPKRLDPVGVVLSIVGLTALVYGIIKGGEHNEWMNFEVMGSIIGGLLVLALFVYLEKRSAHPSLDVTLFKQPAFSASTVALALTFFAMMGATFFMAFYWQVVRDFDPLKAGALVVPVSVGIALTAPISGKTAERFGTKLVVTIGMVVVALSLGSYAFVDRDTPVWQVEALLLLMGLGMGNVMAPATTAIMSTIPREKAGAGSAVNNTVRMVGGALGVAILGSLLSATYRSSLGSDVDTLPEGSRNAAGESIGGTYTAAGEVARRVEEGELSPEALRGIPELLDSAKDSFVHAMQVTSVWAMGFALLGAVIAAIWIPGKDNKRDNGTETAGKAVKDEPVLEAAG